MAKPEWGVKRACVSCATRFYDFRRAPITCPSCGAVFHPDAALKPRRARMAPEEKPVVKAPPKPAPEEKAAAFDPDAEPDPEAAAKPAAGAEEELAKIDVPVEPDTAADPDAGAAKTEADDTIMEDTTDLGGEEDNAGIDEVREHREEPDK